MDEARQNSAYRISRTPKYPSLRRGVLVYDTPRMKRAELAFTFVLVPMDALALLAAAIAAYYARFHPYFVAWRPIIFDLSLEEYLKVAAPIVLVWIAVFALSGLYTARRPAIWGELTRVALACSTSMAAVFAILFFSRVLFESRFIAVAAWVLSIVFVSLGRIAIRGIQRMLLTLGVGEHRIALIGSNETSEALASLFGDVRRHGLRVVASFPRFDEVAKKKLTALQKKDQLDEIVLADPEADRDVALDILSFTDTQHLGFRYSADLFAAATGRTIIHTFGGIPIIEVRKTPLDGWGAIYKRAFDTIFSVLALVIFSPLMLLVAIAIKLESRGPIFYQLDDDTEPLRVGRNGKLFPYCKFRSMYPHTHMQRYNELAHLNTRKGPLVKTKNDPRITRVGRVIRKLSLDELPEFWLVLRGHMSLVGPRPHLPEEVDQYEPHQRKVMTIKPGITGLAQISGRADLDFDAEVRLDTYYIEHWSPWLDLYIMLKTPLAVLFRKGAG